MYKHQKSERLLQKNVKTTAHNVNLAHEDEK